MPKVVQAGVYRTVCVELDIRHLTVAALLTLDVDISRLQKQKRGGKANESSSSSMDMMGGNGNSNTDRNSSSSSNTNSNHNSNNNSNSNGDESSVYQSILLLKSMVATWYAEASTSGNPVANSLLLHVHRLTSAQESLMHDPTIHRVLHTLTTKLFNLLVAELRRLGANLVYADFGRVIIATSKTEVGKAVEYADFVLGTLKGRREWFEHLMVEKSKVFSDLIFLDEVNYGGMVFDDDFENEGGGGNGNGNGNGGGGNVGDNPAASVFGAWNIAQYLASDGDISYNNFLSTCAKFSKIPYEKRRRLEERRRKEKERGELGTPTKNAPHLTPMTPGGLTPLKAAMTPVTPATPVTPGTPGGNMDDGENGAAAEEEEVGEQSEAKRSERALMKTRILAMNPAKLLQT